MSFALDWFHELVKQAVCVQSRSIEISREEDGSLTGRINVGEGLHAHSIGLPPTHRQELLDELQRRTGCLKHIDLDVDRGYGEFRTAIGGKAIAIDIFVHGTHATKLIDLTIRYASTGVTLKPPVMPTETVSE